MSEQSQPRKLIVVSGARGYVGKAVVHKLLNEGFQLACIVSNNVQDQSNEDLPFLKTYVCDLKNQDEVFSTVTLLEKENGPIYGCVHVAGVKPERKDMLSVTSESVKSQLDSNFMTGFNFLQACGRRLKEYKQGVIVAVTTAGVVVPEFTKNLGGYILAKYALQGMLLTLREELQASSVRVYSIAPGFMDGGMNGGMPKMLVDLVRSKSPTKEITNADEVASTIAKLCTDTTLNETSTFVLAPEVGFN